MNAQPPVTNDPRANPTLWEAIVKTVEIYRSYRRLHDTPRINALKGAIGHGGLLCVR